MAANRRRSTAPAPDSEEISVYRYSNQPITFHIYSKPTVPNHQSKGSPSPMEIDRQTSSNSAPSFMSTSPPNEEKEKYKKRKKTNPNFLTSKDKNAVEEGTSKDKNVVKDREGFCPTSKEKKAVKEEDIEGSDSITSPKKKEEKKKRHDKGKAIADSSISSPKKKEEKNKGHDKGKRHEHPSPDKNKNTSRKNHDQ